MLVAAAAAAIVSCRSTARSAVSASRRRRSTATVHWYVLGLSVIGTRSHPEMVGDMSHVTARQPCTHCVSTKQPCTQAQHCLQNEGHSIRKFYKDFLLNDDFYQKFLLCVSSYVEDLYSHQKLEMYI